MTAMKSKKSTEDTRKTKIQLQLEMAEHTIAAQEANKKRQTEIANLRTKLMELQSDDNIQKQRDNVMLMKIQEQIQSAE